MVSRVRSDEREEDATNQSVEVENGGRSSFVPSLLGSPVLREVNEVPEGGGEKVRKR